ncbi:MAG TPA: hypothetical protein VGH54_09585 [Mycobacterium sp.]|jgi:hypothetical protein|uniref:hypothetical protein n=1 Tax=Mycobacterium sp. TaxID=1785 RepID=UPI002F407BB4
MADWTQPTLDDHLTEVATLRETHLLEQLEASTNQVEILSESLADIQLAFDDRGWLQLTTQAQYELSPAGRKRIRDLCRVMAIMNPLMKRGLSLRKAYIWGQGVDITVRDQSDKGQDVNAVVQAFLDDKANKATFSGSQAREEMEQAAYTDGELAAALFTDPLDGTVQLRWVPVEEITDVITDPEDQVTHWYYRREWTERIPVGGQILQRLRTVYYPALGYEPRAKPSTLDGHPVLWNVPVRMVTVNRPTRAVRGVPDSFAAVAWARAYKEFLEQWSVLMKSLARFAWQTKTRGDRAKAVAAKTAAAPTTDVLRGGNPAGAGATVVTDPNTSLEAIPKTGATIDADSGRPLAALTAAALDVPVTMLLGDPGMNGARAVAETLDEPTQLTFSLRRDLWAEFMLDVLNHVIDWAIQAPKGPLKGKVTRTGDRVIRELPDNDDRSIDITWPEFDSVPVGELVTAIVAADGTTVMPPLVTLRLLLTALKVDNIDEVLDEMTDADGNFIDPGINAGQVVVDRFRNGQDPVLNPGEPAPTPPPGEGA